MFCNDEVQVPRAFIGAADGVGLFSVLSLHVLPVLLVRSGRVRLVMSRWRLLLLQVYLVYACLEVNLQVQLLQFLSGCEVLGLQKLRRC